MNVLERTLVAHLASPGMFLKIDLMPSFEGEEEEYGVVVFCEADYPDQVVHRPRWAVVRSLIELGLVSPVEPGYYVLNEAGREARQRGC